jgi:ornithine carbamoyltransferase
MTVTAVAAAETQLARGEALVDTARTLSALTAAIVVRTGSHELLEELASTATVPTMSSPAPVLLPTRPAPRSGFLDDPREAVSGADVVYTDVWTSMDGESAVDTQALAAFRVDGQLMALAAGHAVFLHCLPARRGVEVTADVLDGPSSLVWQHVANQIPVTQALVHSVLSVGET